MSVLTMTLIGLGLLAFSIVMILAMMEADERAQRLDQACAMVRAGMSDQELAELREKFNV